MREVLRSNDPVLINFVVVLLRDGGLSPLLVDEHTSAIEGSIGVLPRRILVSPDELRGVFLKPLQFNQTGRYCHGFFFN